MRRLVPVGLALMGLAVAAPTSVWAQAPDSSNAQPAPTHTHPRGWLGQRKICTECQRAKLRAQGIDMPAPPPLPQGVVMEGGACPTCRPGQAMIMAGSMPGHAVASDSAPGYAVVGGGMPGADPAPISMAQARGRGPGAGRFASNDRSVMQASITPAPQVMDPVGHNRPHVISHLFGVSGIGRNHREEVEKRAGQKHASIRYGDEPAQKVNELPSSMVYGRRWW